MRTLPKLFATYLACGRGFVLLMSGLGAMLVAGCATPMNPAGHARFQSYASQSDRPVTRPVRSISSFSDSLMCMDRLLYEARVPTTLITSKTITDYSTRVPVGTKEMIITALSQMSRVSSAFRFVDYEVNIAQQDTVQNLTTILLNNNQMQLQRPALYVSGGVAFVDQNVLNNRFDIGTSASRLETGYSRTRGATVIGLELHMGDFKSRTIIPGLDSANEVTIGNAGQGLDLAGRAGLYGWKFNVGRDFTQGSGAAIRTLVELGIIELTGKWARVPYWQCLTLDQTHPTFQQQLRDWFDSNGAEQNQRLVQRSLARQGYLPASDAVLPANSPVLKEAIGKFQADSGAVVTGVVDYTTYDRALRNFVKLDSDGKIDRVGWVQTATAAPASSSAGGGAAERAQPVGIRLEIENRVADKTTFASGTPMFLSTRLSRAANLYCYHSNASGNVIRLLPNRSNPLPSVSANQIVRIPDWMAPNPPFVLDTGIPGTESVMCLATDEDAQARLPEAYRAPPLALLHGVHGLEAVEKQFAETFGPAGYSAKSIQWQVVPGARAKAGGNPAGSQ